MKLGCFFLRWYPPLFSVMHSIIAALGEKGFKLLVGETCTNGHFLHSDLKNNECCEVKGVALFCL